MILLCTAKEARDLKIYVGKDLRRVIDAEPMIRKAERQLRRRTSCEVCGGRKLVWANPTNEVGAGEWTECPKCSAISQE